MGDRPQIEDLLGTIKSTIDKFLSKEVDEVYIAYNRFINTVSQWSQLLIKYCQFLLMLQMNTKKNMLDALDYLYEPDAEEVLESLFTRYIESLTYRSVVENIACEQASVWWQMQSSSDNAADLIGELQIIYNKNRQAAITQEISEIISGAAAL